MIHYFASRLRFPESGTIRGIRNGTTSVTTKMMPMGPPPPPPPGWGGPPCDRQPDDQPDAGDGLHPNPKPGPSQPQPEPVEPAPQVLGAAAALALAARQKELSEEGLLARTTADFVRVVAASMPALDVKMKSKITACVQRMTDSVQALATLAPPPRNRTFPLGELRRRVVRQRLIREMENILEVAGFAGDSLNSSLQAQVGTVASSPMMMSPPSFNDVTHSSENESPPSYHDGPEPDSTSSLSGAEHEDEEIPEVEEPPANGHR